MRYRKFLRLKFKNSVWFNKFAKFYYWLHILFFHTLVWCGRKILAFNFFLKIKEQLKKINVLHPNVVFFSACLTVKPVLCLKPLRMARTVYRIPVFISQRKSIIFAIKLILKTLKDLNRVIRLNDIAEVIDQASKGKGLAIDKRNAIYETSLENRHMAHYLKK